MLGKGRGDLLSYHEGGGLEAARCRLSFRHRCGDVSLVAVSNRERHGYAAAHVVKDIADRSELSPLCEAIEVIAEVLSHVADIDARIPAPFGLFLADLRTRHRRLGPSSHEVWT